MAVLQLPYYEGYLYCKKKGGVGRGLGSWNKRFYILKKNKLHHYREAGHKKEKGNIQMKTITWIHRLTNPKQQGKTLGFHFTITNHHYADQHGTNPRQQAAGIPEKFKGGLFELRSPSRTYLFSTTDNAEADR